MGPIVHRLPGPSDGRRYVDGLVAMLRSRWLTHRPFFLAHAATFGCNSRCQTCSYWKLTPRMKEDLSTDGVFRMLDDAYAAGMRGYYLFGGEPLVRRDVGELVEHARRRGFLTTMNTNGSLLAAKASSLRGLDVAFVSLDYFNDHHDVIRGRPGSFREVLHGIERLREETRAKVTLVTTISTLNLNAIEPMARLAQDLGAMISYNAVEPTLDFGLTDDTQTPNRSLGLSPEELHRFYETLLQIKRQGYPLFESETVLEDFVRGIPWRCEFPKMFVYVSPDQKIYSCDYRYGYDLRHGSFEEYFASDEFLRLVRDAESCNRCIRTCVRGYSYTYDLRPQHMRELIGDARRLFGGRGNVPAVGLPPRSVGHPIAEARPRAR